MFTPSISRTPRIVPRVFTLHFASLVPCVFAQGDTREGHLSTVAKKIKYFVGPKIAECIKDLDAGKFPVTASDTCDMCDTLIRQIDHELTGMKAQMVKMIDKRNRALTGKLEIESRVGKMLLSQYPARRKEANRTISTFALRMMVFSRDGNACRNCGSGRKLSVDHVVPVALGGGDQLENLQTLCGPCNSRKGASSQ